MNKIMFCKNFSLFFIGAIAVAVFVIVSTLFQPGVLNLTGPVHTDFYDYFVISQRQWSLNSWLTPRPLMIAYLKLIGIIAQPEIFFILLALPTLLFLTVLPYLIIKNNFADKSLLPLIAFYLVIFGSPFFAVHFQWDFGGMLSGLFTTLAIFQGFKVLTEKNNSKFWWFYPLLFSLISIECKPTFSFVLLATATIGALFIKGRKSKILFLGVLLLLGWVFMKDKYFGPATFLASSDAISQYAVVISPLKNLEKIAFYMKHTFTLPLAIVTLFSSLILIICQKWKELLFLAILTVAATAPMSLLINHPQDTYAIFSTIIIGIIVMISVGEVLSRINLENETLKTKNYLSIITIFLMSIGLILHLDSSSPSSDWLLQNKKYSHNVITSLKSINEISEKKNLFVGLQGPFYAFRYSAFVDLVYPQTGKYDVLLNKSELDFNKKHLGQKNAVYLQEIKWSDYSTVYVFGEEGKIIAKIPTDNFFKIPATSRSLMLYCGCFDLQNLGNIPDKLRVIDCVTNNQEYDATIELGNLELNSGNTNPWVYFQLSRAYLAKNEINKALESINKAVELEPSNSKFASELEKIKSESNKTLTITK